MSYIMINIFLCMFLIVQNAYALLPGMCVPKKKTLNILDKQESNMLSMLKLANTEYAQNNMGDFCRRNLMLRYLNSKQAAPSNCTTISMSDLENLVDELGKNNSDTFWDNALKSTKKSRSASYDNSPEKKMDSFSELELELGRKRINQYFTQESWVANSRTMNAKMLILCGRESLVDIFSCKKALNFLIEKSTPKGGGNLMTKKAWLEIYGTNKYNEGILQVAKKLNLQTAKGSFSKNENIFDDLVSAFKKSGLSLKEAEEGAWNTLAIISNGGQNTASRTSSIENNSRRSNDLNYISRAMGAMDYLKQEKGFPLYSYPSNIKTNCDNAKPYHFWMAAYLSRELIKEGIVGEEEVIKASYLAQKGYQLNRELADFGSGTELTKSARGVLSAESYGPIHQVVRMDLAFSAGGAAFGAKSAKESFKGDIAVDRALVSLLRESTPVPSSKIDSDASDLYKMSLWEKIFAPDAALNTFLKK